MIRSPSSISPSKIKMKPSIAGLESLVAKHVRIKMSKTLYTTDGAHVPSGITHAVSTVALIDISGYSKLTTKITEQSGRKGGAEVKKAVNPIFSDIIDIVEEYDGDIIKFCGDSLIVCWSQSGGSKTGDKGSFLTDLEDDESTGTGHYTESSSQYPSRSVHPIVQGVLCCAKLMNEVDNYHVTVPGLQDEDRNIVLRLHVSLGTGVLHHIYAGIPEDRVEYFVTGPAIYDAAIILDKASSGQLALPNSAWKLFQSEAERLRIGKVISSKIKLTNLPSDGLVIIGSFDWATKFYLNVPGCFLEPVKTTNLNLKELSDFINESLSYRLNQGSTVASDELSELRKLTIAFVRFTNFDTDDGNSCLSVAQNIMKSVLSILAKYEGTMRQFVFDDKGATLLLVWGLPPYSHESEANFALKAALEIKRALYSKGVSIGVATGPVFSGIIGNSHRSDHTVLGQAINLAARLMTQPLAKQNVLVCETTMQEGRDAIDFELAVMLPLKGFATSIPAYLARSSARRRSSSTSVASTVLKAASILTKGRNSLIGRQKEQQLLNQAKQDWLLGLRTICCLSGDAGTGKSSLASHMIKILGESPRTIVATGKMTEVEKDSPFYIFHGIINSCIDEVYKLREAMDKTRAINSDQDDEFREEVELIDSQFSLFNDDQSAENSTTLSGIPALKISNEPHFKRSSVLSLVNRSTNALNRPANNTGKRNSLLHSLMLKSVITKLTKSAELINGRSDSTADILVIPPEALPENSDSSDASKDFAVTSTSALPTIQAPKHRVGNRLKSKKKNTRMQASTAAAIAASNSGELRDTLPDNLPELPSSKRLPSPTVNRKKSIAMKLKISDEGASSSLSNGDGRSLEGETDVEVSDRYDFEGKCVEFCRLLNISPERLPLFNQFGSVNFAQTSFISNLRGDALQKATAQLIVGIIKKLTKDYRYHFCIAVEDVQWMDVLSWNLLKYIFRHHPEVFLLFISRPINTFSQEMAEHFRPLKIAAGPYDINLSGLDRKSVGKYLIQAFGDMQMVMKIEDLLIDKVFESSKGNFFIMDTIVKQLKKSNQLSVEAGMLRFKGDPGELNFLIPSDGNSTIVSQFDKLSPRFQKILKFAAVIGQRFSFSDVSSIMNLGDNARRSKAQQSLHHDHAHSLEITGPMVKVICNTEDQFDFLNVEPGNDTGASFRHVMIQQAIVGISDPNQLEQIHCNCYIHFRSQLSFNTKRNDLPATLLKHLENVQSGFAKELKNYYEDIFITFKKMELWHPCLSAYARLTMLLKSDKKRLGLVEKEAAEVNLLNGNEIESVTQAHRALQLCLGIKYPQLRAAKTFLIFKLKIMAQLRLRRVFFRPSWEQADSDPSDTLLMMRSMVQMLFQLGYYYSMNRMQSDYIIVSLLAFSIASNDEFMDAFPYWTSITLTRVVPITFHIKKNLFKSLEFHAKLLERIAESEISLTDEEDSPYLYAGLSSYTSVLTKGTAEAYSSYYQVIRQLEKMGAQARIIIFYQYIRLLVAAEYLGNRDDQITTCQSLWNASWKVKSHWTFADIAASYMLECFIELHNWEEADKWFFIVASGENDSITSQLGTQSRLLCYYLFKLEDIWEGVDCGRPINENEKLEDFVHRFWDSLAMHTNPVVDAPHILFSAIFLSRWSLCLFIRLFANSSSLNNSDVSAMKARKEELHWHMNIARITNRKLRKIVNKMGDKLKWPLDLVIKSSLHLMDGNLEKAVEKWKDILAISNISEVSLFIYSVINARIAVGQMLLSQPKYAVFKRRNSITRSKTVPIFDVEQVVIAAEVLFEISAEIEHVLIKRHANMIAPGTFADEAGRLGTATQPTSSRSGGSLFVPSTEELISRDDYSDVLDLSVEQNLLANRARRNAAAARF